MREEHMSVSHCGYTGVPGISRGDGATVSFVISSVSRAFLPPSSASYLANLTSASGCRDHTLSPSTSRVPVLHAKSVNRIPRQRFVTIAKRPLLSDRDGASF
jgi:hypothetical protein